MVQGGKEGRPKDRQDTPAGWSPQSSVELTACSAHLIHWVKRCYFGTFCWSIHMYHTHICTATFCKVSVFRVGYTFLTKLTEVSGTGIIFFQNPQRTYGSFGYGV